MVVEAHAVEQATVGREPEQTRLRVAGLGDCRHRAHLGIAEAQGSPHLQALAVFVESGGQPQRGGEAHPEHLGAEDRIGGGAEAIQQPSCGCEGGDGA